MDHSTHHKDGMAGHSTHSHHDHSAHHRMMIADFKKRLWIVAILTIPVLLLSPMIRSLLGLDWSIPFQKPLLFLLSSIVYFYGGWPFLKGLKSELKQWRPGMMTLIAVAISAAFLYSSAVVFGLEGKMFFWELTTLILVMLIGHWLEMRSVLGANKALETLAELMPDTAHKLVGEQLIEVLTSDLMAGDHIIIKPGEKVAADGTVISGSTTLDESLLTGESMPVRKSENDQVIAGSLNGSGMLRVRVDQIGMNSFLQKVVELVRSAQSQKSNTQRMADVAAKWLTIAALTIGFGTLFTWLMLGREFAFAIERMVTVMVICCPHALGLAIPLVTAISTSASARNGILIRNRTAFENARKITTIVFDKTGTLTMGQHAVHRIVPTRMGMSENELLSLAAAVEFPSEHHIAKGLQKEIVERGLQLPGVEDFESEAGVGVKGVVLGHQIRAGGQLLLDRLGIEDTTEQIDAAETKIFILQDDIMIGHVTFADQMREGSQKAIEVLQKTGITCSLLTGDNELVASSVAKKLNMDHYMAEVLPDEKQDKIRSLQKKGEFVAMIGDGVNDAPALAQSDIGIAIGSGTDVAAETADIILVDSDPMDIVDLIQFGRATHIKMVQNLIWATGYNVVAIPLATGLIPSMIISPAVGAALMSLSTVICAVNAQLLKRTIGSERKSIAVV